MSDTEDLRCAQGHFSHKTADSKARCYACNPPVFTQEEHDEVGRLIDEGWIAYTLNTVARCEPMPPVESIVQPGAPEWARRRVESALANWWRADRAVLEQRVLSSSLYFLFRRKQRARHAE